MLSHLYTRTYQLHEYWDFSLCRVSLHHAGLIILSRRLCLCKYLNAVCAHVRAWNQIKCISNKKKVQLASPLMATIKSNKSFRFQYYHGSTSLFPPFAGHKHGSSTVAQLSQSYTYSDCCFWKKTALYPKLDHSSLNYFSSD